MIPIDLRFFLYVLILLVVGFWMWLMVYLARRNQGELALVIFTFGLGGLGLLAAGLVQMVQRAAH